MYRWKKAVGAWAQRHRKQLLFALVGLLAVVIIGQLIYPGSRLVPFTQVDAMAVGGWQKQDVATELNKRYMATSVAVHFGQAEEAYRSPTPADLKLQVRNEQRIEAMNYPWYLRILPGSILWAHLVVKTSPEPEYVYDANAIKSYVDRELGKSCSVKPKNASFKASDGKLVLTKSQNGGNCEMATVIEELSSVKVKVTEANRITIPVQIVPPAITDNMANDLIKRLSDKLSTGVVITAGSTTHTVPAEEVMGWIDAIEVDSKLAYEFSSQRATAYLNQHVAPSVAVKSGVSKVTTRDFVETSRKNGNPGQALDISGTLQRLKSYTEAKQSSVVAVTRIVLPIVEYTRTYSPTDTGLSALLKHYAESHDGTFGISLIELSGERRRASYQGGKSFTTASTYKLFVAYSTLKRVEDGTWRWTDQMQGGRNLEKCFDDMIVRSDNACAEAMLQKIGYKAATNEIKALGLTGSTFLKGDTPLTTAADLSLFNATLYSGQMLSKQASRDRLIAAMKRNIFRKGIPAGTSLQVADKVGFLDGLFHDAAIVYGEDGPYVLTIMSDGSNWATIADLTRQIESLRNQ